LCLNTKESKKKTKIHFQLEIQWVPGKEIFVQQIKFKGRETNGYKNLPFTFEKTFH
jgi:hypothetical protein